MESRFEALREFPIIADLPVVWADMDVFRHVNNTVLFRYFEIARIAYLERIGFTDDMDAHSGAGPILHSTHCRFRLPLVYPDRVHIGARTVELLPDRFLMEYRVVSEKAEKVAADGGGTVVSFDYRTHRKIDLPDPVRRAIQEVEGRDLG